MKRTCLQEDTNTDEQLTCDPEISGPSGEKVAKETKYNQQLITNFSNLYR